MLSSTLMLTLATLIGLAAGFAREWLLIDAWGASLRSDAFLVALFLPEAVRMALATGLFSSAALPLYQEREGAQREAWLSALTWRVLGWAWARPVPRLSARLNARAAMDCKKNLPPALMQKAPAAIVLRVIACPVMLFVCQLAPMLVLGPPPAPPRPPPPPGG